MNHHDLNARVVKKYLKWKLGHLRFSIIDTKDEWTIFPVAYFYKDKHWQQLKQVVKYYF
jgi:hypothetical protein